MYIYATTTHIRTQVFFNIDSFNPTVAVLTILYSWAGLGIAIVSVFIEP